MWRDARYGLRAVRVGEAENRGPPTHDCSATQVDPTMTAGANEIRLTERDVPTDDSESATVPCSPGGVNATTGSRFFCLADECEDTLSDTESVGEDSPPRRRLRLLWQAQAHTEVHRDVQVASHLIQGRAILAQAILAQGFVSSLCVLLFFTSLCRCNDLGCLGKDGIWRRTFPGPCGSGFSWDRVHHL